MMTMQPGPTRAGGRLGGLIFCRDAARFWTEEARKLNPDLPEDFTISESTVRSYVQKSKPGGRYENRPVPPPKRLGRGAHSMMYWDGDEEEDLRQWWRDKPPRGYRSDLHGES